MQKRMCFLVVGLVAISFWANAGLKEYVQQADDSFAYEVVNETQNDGLHVLHVQLTSQTWQGIVWKHWLSIVRPENCTHPDKGLLFITGGKNNNPVPAMTSDTDRIVMMVARSTGSTVSVLRQVPNQPLFNNLTEDALISYTYEKFIEGQGDSWPLLFPMVKSTVRALDAIQAVSQDKFGTKIEHFLVTGGSKRGWTTWLSAVVDKRIERIAPMIIDMLNTREQMKHQIRSYGTYSESIEDYTQRNLQDRMLAGEGDALLAEVDPYSWREELTLPKLIVLGTNDPYWTVDAANLYFDGLKPPKYLYYQANTTHDASLEGVATIVQFYRGLLTGAPFPEIQWKINDTNEVSVVWDMPGGKALLWEATSPNRDFRQATWTSRLLEGNGEVRFSLPNPQEGWHACYVEVQWASADGFPFGMTTRMFVMPEKKFPHGEAEMALAHN